ncbi:MAG: alpha/beta hydrolase [Pseudomonadota bacterium]
MTSFLPRQDKPTLAYHHIKSDKQSNLAPVMFLGGFRSDMEGTKAIYLQEKCIKSGRDYVRFDYSGHGESEGEFENCILSDWAQDATDIMTHCLDRPAILVGSSMGGWISLILAEKASDKIAGLVGLAAAPDFTVWMENEMTDEWKQQLEAQGYFDLPNDYGDPYRISKSLLEDGRTLALLHRKIDVDFPIHLINGKKDTDVPWQTAEAIKQTFDSTKVDITYLDEADHRLSAPDQLEVIWKAVEDLSV